jgi:hypothetical protein
VVWGCISCNAAYADMAQHLNQWKNPKKKTKVTTTTTSSCPRDRLPVLQTKNPTIQMTFLSRKDRLRPNSLRYHLVPPTRPSCDRHSISPVLQVRVWVWVWVWVWANPSSRSRLLVLVFVRACTNLECLSAPHHKCSNSRWDNLVSDLDLLDPLVSRMCLTERLPWYKIRCPMRRHRRTRATEWPKPMVLLDFPRDLAGTLRRGLAVPHLLLFLPSRTRTLQLQLLPQLRSPQQRSQPRPSSEISEKKRRPSSPAESSGKPPQHLEQQRA